MNRIHKDTFSKAGQIRRRESSAGPSVLVRRGRVIAIASALAVAPMITGFPQLSSQAAPHPVSSQVHQLGFVPSPVAALRSAKNATRTASGASVAPDPISTARSAAVAPAQSVDGAVSVVGVTWPRGAATAGDTYQIRTLTGARWSQWQSLDVATADGPDPAEAASAVAATRGSSGTSPYIVTGASKFEVRSLSTDSAVPSSAKVQVVDPGASAADSNAQQAPGSAAAAAARPPIYSRAAWGANESLRRAAPSYGNIMVGFVHHTDSANSYTSAEVPAMLRGIYAYHVQSLGWSDIGYNFLVDRFGRTWEGRYGGIDKAVVGAQTLNFNSVSMGVSAIGNYDTGAVPQAMTNAFKAIFGWKFSLAGIPAIGTVVANGKSLNRVSGHRDAFATACPGRYLYAKVPEIRTGVAAILRTQTPVVTTPPVIPAAVIRSVINRDVDRNGIADAVSYSSGAGPTSLLAGTTRAPIGAGVVIGQGWNALRSASLSPDLTGDGKADIIALDPARDQLRIYLGDGRGSFAGLLRRGPGWNRMNRVLAAGDRNRDGHNDILATSAAGSLIYYPGNGAGSLYPGKVIGKGWNSVSSLTSGGDLNGDRLPDLLATRTTDGAQMMYAGAPGGSVLPGVYWGRGWGPLSPVIGGSDLDGDRYPDVFARNGDVMRTYSTDASGRYARVAQWGAGWTGMTQLSTGADWNGDGTTDLLAVNPSNRGGNLISYGGTAQIGPAYRLPDLVTRTAAFPTVPGADLVRILGDVSGDGYADAVARRTDGSLVFLRGQAGATFVALPAVGTGWGGLTLEPAGDYDGDGVPDILARDAGGNLFVYPLRADLTFKPRMTVGVGFQAMTSVVGTGAFDADAYADVIVLRPGDHALVLFRGRATSGLFGASVLATAQNDLSQILGAGDYNGDGKADLLARSSTGALFLYPGNGLGALGARLAIRGGEGAAHALG